MIPPPLYGPEPLTAALDCSGFDCGVPELDSWLKRRALRAESRSARTYACATSHRVVVGYHCLAAGAVARDDLPRAAQRNSPDPVPVVLLGRLAVDRGHAGRGVGALLLKDAIERTLAAASHIGCRAMMVHAFDERAAAFYARYGFVAGPFGPGPTLFLPLETLRAATVG